MKNVKSNFKAVMLLTLSLCLMLSLTGCKSISKSNLGSGGSIKKDENNVTLGSLVNDQLKIVNKAQVIVFDTSLRGFMEGLRYDTLASGKALDESLLQQNLITFASNSGGLTDLSGVINGDRVTLKATIKGSNCEGDFFISSGVAVGNSICK